MSTGKTFPDVIVLNNGSAAREPYIRAAGIVLGIEYTEGQEYPQLLISSGDISIPENTIGYRIISTDLMKVIRRTLATGDLVEYLVPDLNDGDTELLGVRLIEPAAEQKGEARTLRIEHCGRGPDFSDAAYAEPKSIELSEEESLREGEAVFSWVWETGVTMIIRARGAYFYDGDDGMFGPFRTLLDSLRWSDLDKFTISTESIQCSEIDAESLAELLTTWDKLPIGFEIILNDENWKLGHQGRLVRAE